MKKLLYILGGLLASGIFLGIALSAHAQVSQNYWIFSGGTLKPALATWSLTVPQLGGSGTQCVQVNNSGLFSTSGSGACGSGGGGSFPFTPFTNYNATTTVIGFNGLFSTASSTFGSNLFLTNLSGGFLYVGSGSLVQSAASSSFFGYTPVNPTRAINTSFPIAGGGDLSADRTLTFGGLTTSTAAVIGNIPYFSGVNTFANVATTSETCTYPVVCDAHIVLTGGGAITFNGLATTTPFSNNQFIYTNNAGALVTAASSSFFGYTPVNPTRTINTTFPIAGGGDLSADRTLTFGGLTTSTAAVVGNIPYFTGVNTFANVATSTGTVSSPLTGNFTCVGTACTLGIQAANASQNGYLALGDYQLLHTATTTFTSPLIYTNTTNAVTCQASSGSQAGCLSSTDWNTFNNKPPFEWTPGTNFNANANATSTPIWFKASPFSLFASTTAWIDQLNVGSTTSGTLATSTFWGNILVKGTASSSQIIDSALTTGNCVQASTGGILTTVAGSCSAGTAPGGTTGQFQFNNTTFGGISNSFVNNAGGWLSFGTSTVNALANSSLLILGTSTAPQLTLTDNTKGSSASAWWSFRTAGGWLWLATTSPGTYATTSLAAALSISPNGQVSTQELAVATSTGMVIDWNTTPNQVDIQTGVSAITIGFNNASTSGMTKRILICNSGSAASTVTWSVLGLLWTGGTAPTQTTTANKCDIYSFVTSQATSTAATTVKVFGAATQNF